MKRPFLSMVTVALLIAGCAGGNPKPAPVSAPRADQAPPAAQPPAGPSLSQVRQEAGAANEALRAAKNAAAYAQAWPKFVAAMTALLSHPEAWSLAKDAPAELVVDQPSVRVYKAEGTYLYLQNDPTRLTLWAVQPSGKGQVLLQMTVGSDLSVDAIGDVLILTALPARALLLAWEPGEKGFVPAERALAGIGPAVGSIKVTRSGGQLSMDSGVWRRFDAEGKAVHGRDGGPFLCPSRSSPLETCWQLAEEEGRLVFKVPAGTAALADPDAIKANLSIGYKDSGGGAPAAEASEAANRAMAGLREYLRRPLDQQMAPTAFREFFKGSDPGSVALFELAPKVRVYDVTTRPQYNPQGYALLQWWENPASPQLMDLEVGMYAGLWDAAIFYGSEGERVLVYTSGTFPTQHRTVRTVRVLRYDAGKQVWIPDDGAFSGPLPEKIGSVALDPAGAKLFIHRPNDPPMGNRVELDPKAQSLRICDTDERCLTLEYRNNVFARKP